MSRRALVVTALVAGVLAAPLAAGAQQAAKVPRVGFLVKARMALGPAKMNRGKMPHDVVNRIDRPARALAIHLDPGR